MGRQTVRLKDKVKLNTVNYSDGQAFSLTAGYIPLLYVFTTTVLSKRALMLLL